MRYCLPICVVCVSSHLWPVARQILFWQILPKVGIRSDPPPPRLVQKTNFCQLFFFEGSPNKLAEVQKCTKEGILISDKFLNTGFPNWARYRQSNSVLIGLALSCRGFSCVCLFLVVYLFVFWAEQYILMRARSTPGCSPSSFSSIVEAGRLFSCQPPSPSLSSSSPSPPTPSLPPPSSLLLPRPPRSMSSWRLTAVAARCRAPQVIRHHNPAHFPPIFDASPKILKITSYFVDELQQVNLSDCLQNLNWPIFSSILLSGRGVPFFLITCLFFYDFPQHLSFGKKHKAPDLNSAQNTCSSFLRLSSLENTLKNVKINLCIKFENYLHISKGPYQVFILSGDLYIHSERGIKLLLFADQEIRLRIRRLHHFEIQIDHITGISSKYLFGDQMQKSPTLSLRTGGSFNCYKKV